MRGRRPVTIERAAPFLAMVDRQRFDAAMLQAAVDAGAVFRGGVTVHEVCELADEVEVETDSGVSRARIVIGADGSASRIARHVGVRYRETDLGLEDEIAIDTTPWRGSVLIDFGPTPGSYAWLFPKQSTIAIGVIQRKGDPESTRAYLAEWRARLGLTNAPSAHSTGHLTRWREPDSPLRRGRVIVAGDAAGLLEPWLREGISFALRSGSWAGEAAAAARADPEVLDGYTDRVRSELATEQRAGALLLAAYERLPYVIHRALAGPAQSYFERYGRGETTLARFWPRWSVGPLERIARATHTHPY
jgi:flavin-dependent dehydrogenase